MAKCGAKTKTRNGAPCENSAMPNGRCRLHGGKSTGPPKGSKNAWKNGIYAKGVKDEEQDQYDQIKVGTLDDEIKIMKLQLARAVKAQKEFEEAIANGDAEKLVYEPHEIKAKSLTKKIDTKSGDKTIYSRTETTTDKEAIKKHPDYRKIIFQVSGRIAKLELTKAAIDGKGGDDKPVEINVTITDND